MKSKVARYQNREKYCIKCLELLKISIKLFIFHVHINFKKTKQVCVLEISFVQFIFQNWDFFNPCSISMLNLCTRSSTTEHLNFVLPRNFSARVSTSKNLSHSSFSSIPVFIFPCFLRLWICQHHFAYISTSY
jgi:hypothetical protein